MSTHYNPSSITNGLVLCLDAANKKSYSVNVHPAPVDIHSWCSTSGLQNCTITRDTSVTDSPAGGVPVRMTVTGNDPFIGTYNEARWNLAPASAGQVWTASVWAKGTTATDTAQLFMMGSASSGGFLNATAATAVVGTSWTRITASHTLANTSTAFVQVRLDGPDSSGTGTNIWWDGLQVERNPSATAFSPLTNVNGTTWTDLSGFRNISTLTNSPTFVSTTVGGTISFDGSNDIVTIPNNVNLDTQTPTVEVWVKTNATNQNGFWFEKGAVNAQYALFQEGGLIQWRMNIGGITQLSTTTAIYMNTSSWYQVVGTFTSGSRKLYINGVLVSSDTQTGTISTNNGGMSLGAYGGATGINGYYYNGSLSICKVYNRELSAAEVLQNFNAMRGRFGI